ncbi:MAG: Multi-sensor hybrid histidine kinase [Verrucomicrobiales bacterium]|nr:Multi-sensor hybrid histidine kinase [Verrucomicrobiales bacterium]
MFGLLGSIGFDLYIPRESLKATLLISFLSVWVLVGLFSYLNRYTRRRYFTLWTVAWLFYALWLILTVLWLDTPDMGHLLVWKQWCLGVMAVFLFWGTLQFSQIKPKQGLFAWFIIFLLIWSFVGAAVLSRVMFEIPLFAIISAVSIGTSYNFFRYRKKRGYLGASLLSTGFALWAGFFASFPFIILIPDLVTVSFFMAAILQLFIAVSMIVLVLEEARSTADEAYRELREGRSFTRELETRIQSTEERYRSLFDQASEAIVILNSSDLTILELNRTAERLLGVHRAEAMEVKFTTFCQVPPHSESIAGAALIGLLCDQRPLKLVKKNGGSITCEADGAPIDFEGRPAHQLFIRELTERARLEQQLRQAEKLSALGQMISGIAHELNNPLAVIKGYLELILAHHSMNDQTRADLDKVATEANRAAKLVKNFLAFAREQPPEKKLVSLNELVMRVSELRKFDLLVAGAELVTDLDARLPLTCADEDQLQQVIMNLLSNSLHALLDASRSPVLKISTRVQGSMILVSVEDNGPGIPREIQERIFEPFFTTKSVGNGTGLGLSIAHSILSEHHGRISYYTAGLGGAGFLIEIPVTELPIKPFQTEPLPPRELPPQTRQKPALILVLDDEKSIADLLAEMLSLIGHFPIVANSPPQALSLMEKHEFDLILSDYRMPVMNGQEFYKVVCTRKPALCRKIIFLTGDVVNEETLSFLKQVGNPHLAKPFQLTTLQKTIDEVLSIAT